MPSSTLPGLPTALLAASNASTDLVYVALSPFGATDDRKQDRTNFFAEIPVPVGLGHSGTVQGSLIFYASTNANSITFRAATPAASLVYQWPNASPTIGQVLSASAPAAGVVTLTWVADSSTPGGSTTQLQYNNAGAFGGISGATTDGTNTTFGSTNLRATSPRITTGIQDVNGNELISFTATGSAVNELTLANATTTNPVTLSTTGGDASIGLTITAKGTGITTITGNAIINAGTGATTIGEASLGAEQLRLTSISASRIALSVNSLANATVDLISATQNRSNTNTVANLATLTTNSNGTAAAGFGHSITHQLESSTTDGQIAAIDTVYWKVATHPSRASVRSLSTVSNTVTSERYLICPQRTLTDNVATTVISVSLPSNAATGGVIRAHIQAINTGNSMTAWSGVIPYAGVNNSGTITTTATVQTAAVNINDGGGTMTVTWASVAVGSTIEIRVTADISFTPTAGTFFVTFTVENHSASTITVTP